MHCAHRLEPSRCLAAALAAGLLITSAYAVAGATPLAGKDENAPEAFRARARVATSAAGGDVNLLIQIDKYTPERDRQAMRKALESGGPAAFLDALRKAPSAGHLEMGTERFTIRLAHEAPAGAKRAITLVIDRPVYFVGGGLPEAKPRAGYDLAVVQLTVESFGMGEGRMAAAARVKPGGPAGVEIDDYATEPVKLLSVVRQVR
jgi:hypothetical protein